MGVTLGFRISKVPPLTVEAGSGKILGSKIHWMDHSILPMAVPEDRSLLHGVEGLNPHEPKLQAIWSESYWTSGALQQLGAKPYGTQ